MTIRDTRSIMKPRYANRVPELEQGLRQPIDGGNERLETLPTVTIGANRRIADDALLHSFPAILTVYFSQRYYFRGWRY